MFTPRFNCPDKTNQYYIAKSEGGKNPCIPRPANSTLQFANCVFYAVGRYAELWGYWLSSTNAENFVEMAKKRELKISTIPVLGSIACWKSGNTNNAADGCGHVAIVEQINIDGSITTSESGWSAKKAFWVQQRSGANWGQNNSYQFIGFICPPVANPYAKPVTAIRYGNSGNGVKWMQYALSLGGYLRENEIDGYFGKITMGALLAYQYFNKLDIDGVCGKKTIKSLEGVC